MRMAEKTLLLQILDHLWKEHLLHLDHLRQGIHLRGYAQRDPLNEYKREAFDLFEAMLTNLRQTVTQVLSHLEIRMQEPSSAATGEPARAAGRWRRRRSTAAARMRPAAAAGGRTCSRSTAPIPSTWGKVPRNAPCPCGSGKKFKQCHGRIA